MKVIKHKGRLQRFIVSLFIVVNLHFILVHAAVATESTGRQAATAALVDRNMAGSSGELDLGRELGQHSQFCV